MNTKENKYRKALKNYSTGRGADSIINKIQSLLVDFGAKGIGFEYDDQGRISGLFFKMIINDNDQMIKVPCNWQKTKLVLQRQRYFKDDYHAYRVALANVEDWLDAQMAYIATEFVKPEEIFLPYFMNSKGQTLFEHFENNKFLLPEPA